MRLSRKDLVPVLAIVAGGVIGASLSFSLLGPSSDDDVPPATVSLLFESSAAAESTSPAAARAGTVTGQVTDASTGVPIRAAQVHIASLGLGGLAKQDGRYLLPDVPAGTYTLAATRIGYRTTEVQITVGGDETVEQNFSIGEEALQLGEIAVSVTRDGAQRRALPSHAITAERAAKIASRVPVTPMQQLLSARTRDPSRPIFTPMVVQPEIENLAEVQEALVRRYPQILREAGIGGQVVVWFFISLEGEVLDRRVSQSSGRYLFDEAALEVADVFRFTPALNRNERVQVWIQLPITFEARD